jgi:PAS domain S-box-containing protein
MDTLDNENIREEVLDVTSTAYDLPLISETQGSADIDMHTRSWFVHFWESIRYWLRAHAFSPEWLNAPWNRPVMGYLAAILTPVGAIILTFLLLHLFSTFAFPGAIMILAILGVALLWGTGPGLFATLWGTVLLNTMILLSRFSWGLNTLEYIFETCLFLFIGVIISLVTSRIEHARSEAVAANSEAEIFRQRLNDLFMQAPTPILVLQGPEHRFELVNPPAMHDINQGDIVGKTAREAIPAYASHDFLQLLDQVYTTGTAFSVQELCVSANQQGDGTLKEQYFNMIYQPTRTSRGEVDGVMVLSVDVTEQVLSRKRIEELFAQLEIEKEVLREAQQHLQDSEYKLAERIGQLEAIFQAMVDGVIVFDDLGHVLNMNKAGCDLLGHDGLPDYSLRLANERPSPYDVRDEQRQPLFTEQWPLLRVLKGEVLAGTTATDVIIRVRNGHEIQLNVSGAPVLDPEGHIHGAVIVMRDVTERRRIEQRTHEALDALLAMAQLIGQGFEDADETGDETREKTGLTSQRVAKHMAELTRSFLGCQRLSISIVEPETEILRPLAVVGLSPKEEQLWWAEQQQQKSRIVDSPEQSLVQRLLTNEVVLFDMTQPPWDSYPNPYRIRTMLIAPMSIRDRLVGILTLDYGGAEHLYTSEELALAGAAANLAATIIERDQLLRQRAEMRVHELALRISNQQMAELITLAYDAIIIRNPASTIISWNQGAERLYGWTEQEAASQVSHELLKTRFPHSREVIDNLLALHGQWEGQITHTLRDGRQVIVESRQVLVRDESGQPSAILEINRDITERERLQREREEARANELALREANRHMDDFLGIVSHELRTPLTTIKGNIQLARLRLRSSLREVPADNDVLQSMLEEIQLMLERAERQTNVQNRMVSDLLDISRLQADKLELRLVPCDLATIVHEMVEDQRSTTPKRTLSLEMTEGEMAPVIADPERIGQVLNNYLSNALKYSPVDRPVEVQLKKEGNIVRVFVRDAGPGLTPSEQELVWERFYQVEGIKRQRGASVGLGLGLHICRAIIEQHHGEVGVEGTKGEGSTFWFTLPLIEHDDQETA